MDCILFFWIEKETVYYNLQDNKKPNKVLELMGKWSFSLYLVHTLTLWIFEKISEKYFLGYLISWIFLLISVHLVTYIFYTFIEYPSHKLSRLISNKFKKQINFI